jgi:peroxiredoxin
LQEHLSEIEKQNAVLIAIHGYAPEDAKAWHKDLGITSPLASDSDLVVMKAYEVYNKDRIPHPTTIIIDKTGVIRMREVHENYKERTGVEKILAVLQRLK